MNSSPLISLIVCKRPLQRRSGSGTSGPKRFRFVSMNGQTPFVGQAEEQFTVPFRDSDFSGNQVLSISANRQAGPSFALLQFNASTGTVPSGYNDVNDAGARSSSRVSGTYTLNASGKVSGSFTVSGASLPFTMYLAGFYGPNRHHIGYIKGVELSTGFSREDSQQDTQEFQNEETSADYFMIGGEASTYDTKAPSAWLQSLKKHEYWRVIGYGKSTPTIRFLEPDLLMKCIALLKKYAADPETARYAALDMMQYALVAQATLTPVSGQDFYD